jgi:1,4-alpha-glucan branching enzyme
MGNNCVKNSPVKAERRIHVEFSDSNARQVSIAGTFNDWRPGLSRVTAKGDGKWQTELLLAPGEYEYRLVVDGDWMRDPNCAEQRPDDYSANSVLPVLALEAGNFEKQ